MVGRLALARMFSAAAARKRACGLLVLAGVLCSSGAVTAGQADSVVPAPASGRAPSREGLLPADVLARVELLRDELELIRLEMGRPRSRPSKIAIRGVSPRETTFQAFTLLGRVNQLRWEITGIPAPLIQVSLPPEVRPFDAWQVLNAAYEQILEVKRELRISEQIEERTWARSATPAQVFAAIVQANRELDVVVTRRVLPNDVYHQVKLATHYAAHLLSRFPETKALPETPAFKRGKRPNDVYALLLECYGRVRAIAQRAGVEVLEFDTAHSDRDSSQVRPSEVHDIAILLVSELSYLHSRLEFDEQPDPRRELELKLPSHVYQRGEMLLLQLSELETRTREHPHLLRRPIPVSEGPEVRAEPRRDSGAGRSSPGQSGHELPVLPPEP